MLAPQARDQGAGVRPVRHPRRHAEGPDRGSLVRGRAAGSRIASLLVTSTRNAMSRPRRHPKRTAHRLGALLSDQVKCSYRRRKERPMAARHRTAASFRRPVGGPSVPVAESLVMGLLEPLWNESRASARVAARGFMSDIPRNRLPAFYGRQKVGTNLPPSESLLSSAAGKISAGVPPLCDASRRASLLTRCPGTNINSGAPPPVTDVSATDISPPAPYAIRLVLLPR
jgi:hypothetical protein